MTDLVRELQREYLTDLRDVIVRIRQHGHNLGDHTRFAASFPELLFLSHQLKGSGGSLGFPAITDVARRMNDELRLFLNEAQVPRRTPEELSNTVLALSTELERAVDSAAWPES